MTNEEKAAHFAEMNPLVNALFGRSEDLLEESGMFLPYGAVLMPDEELQLVEVTPPEGEDIPNPRVMTPVIQDALKGQVGQDPKAIAVGTAELVILEEGAQNAIKVYAEHGSGFSMVFYLPWKHAEDGSLAFSDVKQLNADAVIGGWG